MADVPKYSNGGAAGLVKVILVAVVISLAVHFLIPVGAPSGPTGGEPAATVYSRVLASGEIRAGYVTYPPGCIKDPNTGELSGIFVDALEQAAKAMDLKIVWAEEVSWGTMIEGLKADRYDLVGSPVWENATRGKHADFTVPLCYSGIGVFVRADDTRFGAIEPNLDRINLPMVRLSTIDGEMSSIIASHQFPKAKTVSLPQLSDNATMMLNVAEGKADVTFVEPYIAEEFLQAHPGTLKNIAANRPIRIFPNTMMYRKGATRFGSMMDTAIRELHNTGGIDVLLKEYAPVPGTFYAVAPPYGD